MAGISCLSRPRQVTIHLLLFFRSFRVIMNETSVSLTDRSSSGFTIDPIGRGWPLFPPRWHPSNNATPLAFDRVFFSRRCISFMWYWSTRGSVWILKIRRSQLEQIKEQLDGWYKKHAPTSYYVMILLFSCQKIIGWYKYQTSITESFRFI